MREEKYTIEGAKKILKDYKPESDGGEQLELLTIPQKRKIKDDEIRQDMIEVKEFLEQFLAKLEK